MATYADFDGTEDLNDYLNSNTSIYDRHNWEVGNPQEVQWTNGFGGFQEEHKWQAMQQQAQQRIDREWAESAEWQRNSQEIRDQVNGCARITPNTATVSQFVLAGKAVVTLRSAKTGQRYTFKIQHKRGGDVSFVSLLTGPNNETDYSYLGLLPDTDRSRLRGVGSGKSRHNVNDPAPRAFQYLLDYMGGKTEAKSLEIWHEGRCGRCGRKLTVPSSIESGIGPECASKLG